MRFITFTFYIEGIFLVVIGLLGLIGNTALIGWFSRNKCIFHRLMITLAICDSLYIASQIFIFSVPKVFTSVSSTLVFTSLVTYILPLAHILMTANIYLTLAITIERYTTVCHPFYKISHAWRSSTYIIPITVFSTLYNIPKFFELSVIQRSSFQGVNSTNIDDIHSQESEAILNYPQNYSLGPTSLRRNYLYVNIYLIYMNVIVNGLVPFVLIFGLNIATYRKICQMQRENFEIRRGASYQREHEIKLSQISLAIAAVFVLCHTVKWIPNTWELITMMTIGKVHKWPTWVNFIASASHLLIVFNSSVNFFIYFAKHRQRKLNTAGSIEMDTMAVRLS